MTYIAFEGGEGSGKSTQARLLARDLDAVLTREPGGTELGAKLRSLVLDPGQASIGSRAETLMMAADRAQHVRELVRPSMEAGRHVVSDRSVFSSLAYQGGGRQLGIDAVRKLNEWALDGCWPDIVVLLDLDLAVAGSRLSRSLDRLEQEAASFHERVRCAYLELAANDDRWIVIDASSGIKTIAAQVQEAVTPLLRAAR